jgi:hypothetical protein
MSTNPLLIFNAPIATVGLTVFDTNGVLVGTRGELNIIAGTNITVTGSDNISASRVDLTIAATGGASVGTNLNIAPFAVHPNTSSGLQNRSLIMRVPFGCIVNTANTWTLTLNIATGTATLGTAVVMRTSPYGTAILDSTPITFGGTSGPVFTPGVQTSDVMTLTIDNTYDHYIGLYFKDVAGNGSVTVSSTTAGAPLGMYSIITDKVTGATVVSGFGTISTTTYCIVGWTKVS